MNLSDLKPLTTEQYDQAHQAAIERVKSRIRERPNRQQYERELGRLWTITDVLALVIFIAALVISSLHIMEYVRKAVSDHITINQVAYIFLAEASMVLFMVMHVMTSSRRSGRPALLKPLSVHLALAGLAATFIFVANLESGVGLLLSVMPPVFTIGIAINLERLIVASIKRRNEVNERYLSALADYEAATNEPENHSQFRAYFAQALWDRLMRLGTNKRFIEAPAGFKVAAIQREMQREAWMDAQPTPEVDQEPGEQPERYPFGSTAHEQEESGFMLMAGRANGHGGTGTMES
jgi:hypothetical protein